MHYTQCTFQLQQIFDAAAFLTFILRGSVSNRMQQQQIQGGPTCKDPIPSNRYIVLEPENKARFLVKL